MATKLHRCPLGFLKTSWHGCWQVEKALNEAGVDYELVKVPVRSSKRDEVLRLTGQQTVPVIEFEDGTAIREESKVLVEKIRSGELFQGR
jgi:glutathione S-transferase